MVFRNRMANLRPIHRIKHVIDKQAGVVLAVQNFTDIVSAVDAPVIANTDEVEVGSKVNAIYLDIEVSATSAAALANVYLMVAKNPGSAIAAFPAPNAVGTSQIKKLVFHQEMVMLQKNVASNPRTLFKGVIMIPKHMRRMGPGDNVFISVLAPGVNIDLCIQCHYKEFR